MPYELNPHRHTKIWLSKNRDIFLNQENQLRLVHMRVTNPTDEIHLVYAKTLLSDQSLANLEAFCKIHAIIPISIEKDVLPNCTNDIDEMNLITLYQKEIKAINNGGSLAAASDILRWLKPIYSCGIYSDFDVTINTSSLPKSIIVNAPIIIKVGSIQLPIAGLPQNNLEMVALNNDSIAVAGHDLLTQQKIKKIQQHIYSVYQNSQHYTDYIEKLGLDLALLIGQQVGVEAGFETAAQIIQQLPALQHTQLVSNGLGLINPDPIHLRQAITTKSALEYLDVGNSLLMFKHSYQAIIDNQTMSPALFAKFKYRLTMTDDELIKTLEEDKLQELLIATVTHSTGPNALLFSLFDNVALSASSVDKEIKPYSFQSYHLHDAFYSKNYIKLHTPPEIVVQKLSGEIGDICDVSWIEKGAQAVARREEKINQAARDIQCLFRGFKDRRVAAEARQLQRKAIATPPESERFIDELHKHSMFKHSAEPTQQPQEFDGLSSNHEHT